MKEEIERVMEMESVLEINSEEGEEGDVGEEVNEKGDIVSSHLQISAVAIESMRAAVQNFKLTAVDIPVFHAKQVPRQKNGCDCGVFMIDALFF